MPCAVRPSGVIARLHVVACLVLATFILVSSAAVVLARDDGARRIYGTDSLPEHVASMRDALLDAVDSGDIEDLAIPIEMNELPPVIRFGAVASEDPMEGVREMGEAFGPALLLKQLRAALELPAGRDGDLYVWPYVASLDMRKLNAPEADDVRRVEADGDWCFAGSDGQYVGPRIAIGADGTWHSMHMGDGRQPVGLLCEAP